MSDSSGSALPPCCGVCTGCQSQAALAGLQAGPWGWACPVPAAGSRQCPSRSTTWHSWAHQPTQWHLKGNIFKEGHKMLRKGEWERQWQGQRKGEVLHGGALPKDLRPLEEPCWRTHTSKHLQTPSCCPWINPGQNRGNKNEEASLERRVFSTCSMNKEGKEVFGVNWSLERGRKCFPY